MPDKFRILLVDDNANNRYTLQALLAKLPDIETVEADSGQQALMCTLEQDIHLILLDVQMPGMDGYETARHLQMTERTRHIPVIFLTAVFTGEEFVRRGYDVGAVDYLSKPIDDNHLLARVRIYRRLHERSRELEASEANFKGVVESAGDGIIATDQRGDIVLFNQAAERMFGYMASEIIGRNVSVLMTSADSAAHGGYMQRYLDTDKAHVIGLGRDAIGLRKDGSCFPIHLALSETRTRAQGRRFTGIISDITAQKETQAALIEARDEALANARQLRHTLENLHVTQDKLVQSEKLAGLGSIVAAVAHELNTPIGNCLMVASTLIERTRQFVDLVETGKLHRSELNEYAQNEIEGMTMLENGLSRAAELITNFKQVAVDQSSSRRREFGLAEVINGVIVLLRPTLRKSAHQFQIDIPPEIRMESHPGPIEQVVINLINNSVLHGFEGREQGTIQIAARADGCRVRLVYTDDGAGMSEEVRHRIFEPFFTTRLGKGGSGLGLSICYNLVTELLGGSIEVSTTPGAGCVFTIDLPRVVTPVNNT